MEDSRYSRLEGIPWWDQKAVAGARAIVLGCGALGNEVIKNLLLIGWGNLIVVDFDRVELSNLTRSVLFRSEHIGEPKATVIERVSGTINPDCKVVGLSGNLKSEVSAGMIRNVDAVFGCLDSISARVTACRLAGEADRPYIDGGLSPWEASVRLFLPSSGGACYLCGLSQADHKWLSLRRSCPAYAARATTAGGVPTTPTGGSLAASLMVQQSLKWLHRLTGGKAMPVSRELRFDLLYNRFWNLELPRNEDCVLHPTPIFGAEEEPVRIGGSWAEILDHCRRRLGAGVALHLPLAVLETLSCLECGWREQINRTHDLDEVLSCKECGASAIPRVRNQVVGDEEWFHLAPAEMGFPPGSWITASAEDTEWVFELEQSRAEPLQEGAQ